LLLTRAAEGGDGEETASSGNMVLAGALWLSMNHKDANYGNKCGYNFINHAQGVFNLKLLSSIANATR
jgi:hypothetical protein